MDSRNVQSSQIFLDLLRMTLLALELKSFEARMRTPRSERNLRDGSPCEEPIFFYPKVANSCQNMAKYGPIYYFAKRALKPV